MNLSFVHAIYLNPHVFMPEVYLALLGEPSGIKGCLGRTWVKESNEAGALV